MFVCFGLHNTQRMSVRGRRATQFSLTMLADAALHSILTFAIILFLTRLLGNKQLSQLTFVDYVTGITLGDLAGLVADAQEDRILKNLIILIIFAVLTGLLGWLQLRHRLLNKVVTGEPTVVIHNGKILEKNLGTMRYSIDDLTAMLRLKDIFDTSEVEFAIMETNGQISVLKKASKKAATREDLSIPSQYEGIESELVIDGQIIYQNLLQNHLDGKWLMQKLAEQGVQHLSDVVFAGLNANGELYIDLRDDHMPTMTDISDWITKKKRPATQKQKDREEEKK